MAEQASIEDYLNSLLSDVNVRLRDLEDKQNMIKDRVVLIGENIVAEKERMDIELAGIKKAIKSLDDEMKKLRLGMQRILNDNENLARKTELESIRRQFAMFEPMQVARISDVENIVRKMLKEEGAKEAHSERSKIRMSGLG